MTWQARTNETLLPPSRTQKSGCRLSDFICTKECRLAEQHDCSPTVVPVGHFQTELASMLLFILHGLYFDQWPLQTVFLDLLKIYNLRETEAEKVCPWFLTPGNWLLLDLLPWPLGLLTFCLVVVFWVCLLILSSSRALVVAQSSSFRPHPEYTVLLDLILGIILSLKLCAKNDKGPTALCQKHRIAMLLGRVGKKCWECGGPVYFDLV